MMSNFDRNCDRCGADAKVHVYRNYGTLQFCNHHFLQYADALEAKGWSIDSSSLDFAITTTERVVATIPSEEQGS